MVQLKSIEAKSNNIKMKQKDASFRRDKAD